MTVTMDIIGNIYSQFTMIRSPTINLLLVMVIIWTTGVLFRKIKQSPVLGELLAGIIFGPPVLGIIQPDETLKVLSELGVFFLMFHAGLETDPYEIKHQWKRSLLVAAGGFFVPFISGFLICLSVGTTHIQALFIGMALSITAIALNARLLTDLKLINFRVTPVIIGASIIDDILCLAVFTVVLDLASGAAFSLMKVLLVFSKVLAFFGAAHVIGMILYPKLKRYFASREAKGFTFAMIMALCFGVLAELAGLHIILGAYLAGLFVRKEIFKRKLYQKISDRFVGITYGFLGPIFFVSLSFHVTFTVLETHLPLLIILLLTAVIGKLVGAGGFALLGNMTIGEAAVVGTAMNGRGAVELIIASIGLEFAIINDVYFSILVFVAFITTLIPPTALSILLKRVRLVESKVCTLF
jgi:Kef-type K+ transport system membrane component KefB